MIMKIHKYFIAFIIVFFTSFSYGANSNSSNNNGLTVNNSNGSLTIQNAISNFDSRDKNSNYNTLNDVFNDFGNRFILGVFGKSALKAFLGNELSDNLKISLDNLTQQQIEDYSKPFNSNLRVFTIVVLKSTLTIVFIIMFLYLAWLYMETLLRTQESGEFLGKSWNKFFSPVKVMLMLILIIPSYGKDASTYFNANSQAQSDNAQVSVFDKYLAGNSSDYSLAQVLVFKVMGLSNQYANKIWTGFVDSQRKYYPAIKMPNVVSKRNDFINLINYLNCSKATSSSAGMGFVFGIDSNLGTPPYYSSKVYSGDCKLTIKLPFDASTLDYINNTDFLSKLNINIDYKKIQEKMIEDNISSSIHKANIISGNITKMINEKNASVVTSGVQKNDYVVNDTNWRSYCGSLLSGGSLPNYITDKNINLYEYYSASCLSRDYLLNETKMPNIQNLEYPYSKQNYLTDNKVELCAQSEGVNKNNPTQIITGNSSNGLNIASCINSACSKTSGSSYACSSAINLAKTLVQNKNITEKGWILSGAYSYKLFSSYQNAVSQSLIDNIKINFDKTDFPAIESAQGFVSPNQNNTYINDPTISQDFTTDVSFANYSPITSEEFNQNYQSLINQKPSIDSSNDNLSSNIFFGADGFLGVNRFLTCVKNPLKITNGYSCKNVTEETQSFGLKLLASAVELKIINKIASVRNSLQNNKKVKKLSEAKVNPSLKNAKFGMTKIISYFSVLGLSSGGIYELIDPLISFHKSSFSNSEMDIFFNRDIFTLGALGAMEGLLTSSSTITSFLFDVLIALGILLGVILPLFPFFIFLVAFSGWALMFFESLITILVWAVSIVSPTRDHGSEVGKKGLVMLLNMFLRAPLIVFGLVVSWLLNNILIGDILSALNIGAIFTNQGGVSIKSVLDLIVVFGVEIFMLYLLYSLIFSMIEGFYEIAEKWLFGSNSSSPFGEKGMKRKGELSNLQSNFRQIKK